MNTKPCNIEIDRAVLVVSPASPIKASITMYQSTEYVIQANCYNNQYSNAASTFSATDNWSLYIGSALEPSPNPLITITDANKWNQVSDWSSANVDAGLISCRINTSGTQLSIDLANNASNVYTMEIWNLNDNSESTLILDTDITIFNSVEA